MERTRLGGDDTIYGNAGSDFILGGFGSDTIYGGNSVAAHSPVAGSDTDLIIGDNGSLLTVEWVTTGLTVATTETTDTSAATGGTDTIEGNEGDDLILGGVGGDTIHGDDGDDMNRGRQRHAHHAGLRRWTPAEQSARSRANWGPMEAMTRFMGRTAATFWWAVPAQTSFYGSGRS